MTCCLQLGDFRQWPFKNCISSLLHIRGLRWRNLVCFSLLKSLTCHLTVSKIKKIMNCILCTYCDMFYVIICILWCFFSRRKC